MILKIIHNTHYQFTMPQVYALQQLRLRPINKPGVTILNWQISVTGGDQQLSYKDQHENQVDLVLVSAGGETLIIHCEGEVQTDNLFGIMGDYSLHGPTWLYEYGSSLTYPGPLIKKLARSMRSETFGDVELLHNLSSRILERVPYQAGLTNSATSAENAFKIGGGVCQDHTHIFISAARLLGYPARYISGYLLTGDRLEQNATHAWAEVFLQNLGWVGFDVSNGISPSEAYVPIAVGLDYCDAAPVSGINYDGVNEELLVSVEIEQ